MTRHPALLILALWAAGLGAAAQFGKISVIFDLLVADYGAPGRVAFMVSVVGLVGLVFGTTAGIFGQRIGLRRVLLGALLLGAALSAFQALLPPYPVMMASRILEGASHLGIVVAGPVLIAQTAPQRHQGLAMTLWSSFFGLSFAGLAVIGPWLADWQGVRALFLAHSGYMLVIAAVLAVLLPRLAPAALPPLTLAGVIRQHGTIYRSPRMAAPAMGFFFYTILYVALLTLLPPMLGADRTLAATAMPLVSIGVSLTLGVWLLHRLSAVHLVQAGFALALLASVGMGLCWQMPVPRLTAVLVLAAALGIVQGASFAAIPQLNADGGERSLAAGAVAQLGNLGTTTGTPLLAALIAGFGAAGVVGFAVPLCLGGIVLHSLQARRRRRG
ncbi:MAG: MFS transporter [Rhodobacter sp.]|nr:MFS transporter [Rhodobacter sp.]